MNVTICVIGGLLVESLARGENWSFSCPDEFWGPYPSGAPAIFADQVAKLGFSSVLSSCVGNDAFGEIDIARLEKDGTNINGIAMLQRAITGSAFVSYRNQAQHDFTFSIPNSAHGLLTADHIDEALLNQYRHLRIMGSSLFSFCITGAMHKVIENIKGRNGTVSSDPNIRKEMLNTPEMSQAFEYILGYTDIFLPNGGELDYFGLNPERNGQILVDNLLKRGVKHVVIKHGLHGTSYFSANEIHHVVGFNVPVVNPTGAGDYLGTTFVSLFLNGTTPQEALRWANASGPLTIDQRGPIEGTSTQTQIHAFLTAQHL